MGIRIKNCGISEIQSRRTVRVPFENIVSVMSDAHYLDIALSNGTELRSRMTMPQFMEQTNGDARFIPINKGITVNADYITDFENNCCILENNVPNALRRKRLDDVLERVAGERFRHTLSAGGQEDQQTSTVVLGKNVKPSLFL